MPNWAEGVLKIRGAKEDVRRFLEEGLQVQHSIEDQLAEIMGKEVKTPTIEYDEDEWELTATSPNGFYIKGTRRAFIDSNIQWYFRDDDPQVLVIDSFRQAWSVDAREFAEISEKYNIDIKIYVFEQGMEFNQDIEIHKGSIVKDDVVEFDDYEWECIFPNLGG